MILVSAESILEVGSRGVVLCITTSGHAIRLLECKFKDTILNKAKNDQK